MNLAATTMILLRLIVAAATCWLASVYTASAATPDAALWRQTLARAELMRSAPRLSGLEQRLTADGRDGRLDSHNLLEASLIASGVDNRLQRAEYEQRVDAWMAELRQQGRLTGNPLAQARAIHEYLHEHAFTGRYRDDASDLTHVFERGEFNCVSSAVLFLCLARRAGLPAHGVELPGHALAQLRTNRETVDIETTCDRWFEVLNAPGRLELVRQVTGYRRGSDSQRRVINDVQLIAILDRKSVV